MSKPYQPTPEDLAKAERRRLKKEQAKLNPPPKTEDERGGILPREWLEIPSQGTSNSGHAVRLMTWNVSRFALLQAYSSITNRFDTAVGAKPRSWVQKFPILGEQLCDTLS